MVMRVLVGSPRLYNAKQSCYVTIFIIDISLLIIVT